MLKSILISTSILAVGVVGAASLTWAAGSSDKPSVVADFGAAPVFPSAKEARVSAPDVAPAGAQYRVRRGRTGVGYVACNEQRAYPGGAVELHCVSFSKAKGWGKSLRWIPRYQLAALTGPMPAEPVATAAR